MRGSAAALGSALGLGLLSAAVASPALFGLAIGLVLLSAAAWALLALSARSVAVQRLIGPTEVQEDAPIHLQFAVTQSAWLPVKVEIAEPMGGWLAVTRGEAAVDLRIGRPGAYRLAPSTIRLRDPIGLFERRMTAGRWTALLVLPAPSGRTTAPRSHGGLADDPEPQGLAPYAAGAPIARIHWPALARGAGLQVRHLAASSAGLPLVVVDIAGAGSAGALDWTARTAAGHILTFARTGGCRVLLPGDAHPTPVTGVDAAWRAVHRRLATLGDPAVPATTAPRTDAAAFRVRAAAAPAQPTPPPSLPNGVRPASRCPPQH